MGFRIQLIDGDSTYNLYNLAQATAAGEALEYQQFLDKLRDGAEAPAADLGVDGEFHHLLSLHQYVQTHPTCLLYTSDAADE